MVHYQHNQNILLLFKDHKENFVLSLHYNGNNRLLFLNTTKIHQFKAKKTSEIKPYSLCLGNI